MRRAVARGTIQNAQNTAQATSDHDTRASAIDQTYADNVTNENAYMQNQVNSSEWTFEQQSTDADPTYAVGMAQRLLGPVDTAGLEAARTQAVAAAEQTMVTTQASLATSDAGTRAG